MKRMTIIIAALCSATLAVGAGLDQFAGEAGYVDLGDLRQFEEGNSVTEVIVKDNLIRMVAAVVRKEEPEFAEMLSKVKLVHVHVVEASDSNMAGLSKHIEGINAQLDGSGWDVMVRMREGDEQNHIYILPEGDTSIRGLCVLATDGNEAVFVNIVGTIDIDMLTRLGEQFDIPGMEDVEEAVEDATDI